MAVKVLASGVDTLHLSARGMVRDDVWELVDEAKGRAVANEELAPVEFERSGQAFNVRPYGLRGYAYWLSSPDFELVMGKSRRFPAVLVQLHSGYLHSMGAEEAVRLVRLFLGHDVFAGSVVLVASRLDVYADVQGWSLGLADLPRFVGKARSQRAFLDMEDERQVFSVGGELTGLVFGRDALMARIYDKTREIAIRGLSWLPDLWGDRGAGGRVWRVEFQARRRLLAELQLRSVDETLWGVQDLWRYATDSWLTLRTVTDNRQRTRWPVDPVWRQIQAVRVAPEMLGVVRRRMAQAEVQRLVQGQLGYLSSLGAVLGTYELEATWRSSEGLLRRYLAARQRTFAEEVKRKAERRMLVSAWLDEDAA